MDLANCSRCKQSLSVDKFNRRKNGKPCSFCILCQREYSREHYRIHKKEHNARRSRATYGEREALRRLISASKDRPCMDCGERHPSWAMEYDHRDPKLKVFTIGEAVSYGWSKDRIVAEMAKCDLVCCLCHRYRTYGARRGLGSTPASYDVTVITDQDDEEQSRDRGKARRRKIEARKKARHTVRQRQF